MLKQILLQLFLTTVSSITIPPKEWNRMLAIQGRPDHWTNCQSDRPDPANNDDTQQIDTHKTCFTMHSG